jgi:hypothetical protein
MVAGGADRIENRFFFFVFFVLAEYLAGHFGSFENVSGLYGLVKSYKAFGGLSVLLAAINFSSVS